MEKLEAAITPRINKWFELAVPTSSPWEIKHTRGEKNFRLSNIEDHQIRWLLACTTPKGATWKIPDIGKSYNPFDVMHYKNTPAYVIIAFPVFVVVIEIRRLVKWESPSISEMEALKLSSWHIRCDKLPK